MSGRRTVWLDRPACDLYVFMTVFCHAPRNRRGPVWLPTMPLQSSVRALKKPRLDDEVRFLRSWIEKPLHMGAVMPSSKLLARTMAEYVDVDAGGPVVEL